MKQRAEWYDTCLAVTRVFAANVYCCWWAPLHSGSQAQLFWSLVLLFLSPFFPVFCLLATTNQSLKMEAEPLGTCLLGMRSWDEMNVIMGTRQLGGHLHHRQQLTFGTSLVNGIYGRAYSLIVCLCQFSVCFLIFLLFSNYFIFTVTLQYTQPYRAANIAVSILLINRSTESYWQVWVRL